MIESDRVPGADDLYATVGDRRIRYLRAGDAGPPVVLLHGSGIDDAALSWRHVIPALAEDYRVYAPDWPGYGESDAAAEDASVEYFVEVLAGFLDATSIERPILVGISMGGAAALGLTLRDQDRVRGLGLISSYGLRDEVPGGTGTYFFANTPFAATLGSSLAAVTPGGARAAISPFVASTSDLDDGFLAAVSERLRRTDAVDAWMAFQRAEFRPNGVRTHYRDRLSELSVPTLYVHGDSDPLIPLDWARDAAAASPAAELVVLADCGHWPPRERPTAFLDALEPWLAER